MVLRVQHAVHGLMIAVCAFTAGPAAAQSRFEALQIKGEDILKVLEAHNQTSDTCAFYEGMAVKPVSFEALTNSLPKLGVKGEFETTAQYDARVATAVARIPKGHVIVGVTPDRDFSKYVADLGLLLLANSAFRLGEYSAETGAALSAMLAVDEAHRGGTPVPMLERERVTGSYAAQNRFGASFRVSTIDRRTWALHLTNLKPFPVGSFKTSVAMAFKVPPLDARRVKQSFQLALAVKPLPPYVMTGTMDEIPPSASDPRKINEHSTVLLATAECALVLGADSHVLAVIDVGQ